MESPNCSLYFGGIFCKRCKSVERSGKNTKVAFGKLDFRPPL